LLLLLLPAMVLLLSVVLLASMVLLLPTLLIATPTMMWRRWHLCWSPSKVDIHATFVFLR
jgi:hypothetical protein